MAIPDFIRQRFDVLQRACANGDLAVMECGRASDPHGMETVYVLCAANHQPNGSVMFTPLGEINADDNPYESYVPPSTKAETTPV